MISVDEDGMRQVKRLFYFILLNIIISAITVAVVLQLWQRDHPPLTAESSPAAIVMSPTQAITLSVTTQSNAPATGIPTDTGVQAKATVQATPTIESVNYRVKEGDTLGALAAEFNTTVEDIMIVNGLTDPNSINVGQLLHIPTAPLPKATDTSVPSTVEVSPTPRPSATSTQGPTPTSTATQTSQEPQVIIDTVIGAGVLENEHVVLRRTGEGQLSLAGWRIEDGAGKEYIFPELTLYKDGAVNLNTRTGQNTVVDLFWDLTSPIWKSGKIVSLYDPDNNLRASYTVP